MIKFQRNQDQVNNFMAQRRQILNKNTDFAIQEAYKQLRTNIRFCIRDQHCKKFCITSSQAGEGKSITILNLAISIAQTGKKVLLIDADMRRPTIARLLVEKASPGLSEVLLGEVTNEEAVHPSVYPNLDILFSGEIPPNPSEILSGESFAALIEASADKYDYILVDTPPVNVVTDACVIANLLDGVLLLVREGRTNKEEVRQAINNLQLTGAKILGYILNGVAAGSGKYYSQY